MGKRSGTINSSTNTSSSSTSIATDGQFNRNTSGTVHKILKPPIRIDRMDVKEYDRRGGSSSSNEPNTASFVALVFSEYNLIECGYLFQTNLSKQWIENIRTSKANFQLLLEESKKKLQNAHNYCQANNCHPSSASALSTTTNPISNVNIHQSLPSLSSTSETSLDSTNKLQIDGNSLDSSSTDEPNLSMISLDSSQQSLKIETDSTKLVETRRNSRSDPKNFGRFFTADGTSVTHNTNPSTSSINPSSSKSTTIYKRLSWTNEPSTKSDLTATIPNNELSNTNSFRSVHSSSGVSSTGSFLFSGDEEPAAAAAPTTTSSSLPGVLSSTNNNPIDDLTDDIDEFDGKSSSSTVIGTDDHEQSLNLQNSIDLENNNIRLSTASTSTLTTTVHTQNSSPEMSLRRTPYASVKKRNPNTTNPRINFVQPQSTSSRRNRLFDENDLRSSTHTIVYDSSKTTLPTTATTTNNISVRRIILPSDDSTTTTTTMNPSSLAGSGNESDYDNNQMSTNDYSKTMKFPLNPVNDLRPDDLVLGDQNEIVLTTDLQRNLADEHQDEKPFQSTNLNQQQSDTQQISTSIHSVQSTTNHRISSKQNLNSSLDDSAPTSFTTYRKDPITTKKLLDIRSHLLLNTTLDATEV